MCNYLKICCKSVDRFLLLRSLQVWSLHGSSQVQNVSIWESCSFIPSHGFQYYLYADSASEVSPAFQSRMSYSLWLFCLGGLFAAWKSTWSRPNSLSSHINPFFLAHSPYLWTTSLYAMLSRTTALTGCPYSSLSFILHIWSVAKFCWFVLYNITKMWPFLSISLAKFQVHTPYHLPPQLLQPSPFWPSIIMLNPPSFLF